MLDEIVVSGMGSISGIGNNLDETLQSCLQMKCAIKELQHIKSIHKLPCAEVSYTDAEMKAILNIADSETATRTALMGMIATQEALNNAKITNDSKYRIAFLNGTTVGGMEKSEMYYFDFLENDKFNHYIEAHDCGACTEKIADYFGCFSYVGTPSTACSSAANAIMLGAELIRNGEVDIVVAGGSECITKFHLNGFNSLMILDKEICRPFDETRAGLNLGEGAAYIVIESSKLAEKRKIKPLCKLSGYGNACDAYHQTASSPDGDGAVIAMTNALETSGIEPKDIDYINAHGTGTPNNDESEGKAIARVFLEKIPYISSTKSITGHTTSAAGGVESVISILSLNNRFVPGNYNFKTQMSCLPFKPVSEVITNVDLKHVLSNSFGFGGNNSSLVFSKI
ncbi:MAG TPA: beta-ketoacyl-[acyl-carrier-protein] synthase family protein [Bacteroidales bacterium]|jgi:3-oxoacyl-[acyl-carrier-protein] synthase-1|nr:beta-ketoacyl-[acyl-carrier-protein] synthase family protein [Bacteroidales bacterium]HXK80811.1 beta-ketoacyl-[acyl-carrier-protein] synthase family protein [Bacteroidales bacterium]